MLRLMLELWFPILVIEEVAIPLVRQQRVFPLGRLAGNIFAYMISGHSGNTLKSAARARLSNAQTRIEAARTDLTAADLERKAQRLEDEANKIREGEER